MSLIAIPNVSEGVNQALIRDCVDAMQAKAVRLLDLHSDGIHNRTVLTCTGPPSVLVAGLTELAKVTRTIDLTRHTGIHPRLGGLDVCPVVAHEEPAENAVAVARATAISIGDRVALPVYLYGDAASDPKARTLPALRRGGLEALIERARSGFGPDAGPEWIDPRRGVVCVGARGVLIAFNVWLDGGADAARAIASRIRVPEKVRALGLPLPDGRAQVSLNLVEPEKVGIDAAFDAVRAAAADYSVAITATEIVGLPPERFLPDPTKEAARLLMQPGRSLESALAS